MKGEVMENVYEVKGMSCQGCARAVAGAIASHAPNVETEVSVQDATVTVRGEHEPAVIETAVEEAGFTFGGLKGSA